MYRSTHFHRWGPIALGTLLLAACPPTGEVASGSDPDSSTGESASTGPATSTPTTTDSATSDPPNTTDKPTTTDPTTTTDSSTTGPIDPSGGETGDLTTSGSTDADSSSGGGSSGGGSSGGGTTDGTTGEPAQPGTSVSQTVSGGKVASSVNFRMVFTFGQPTLHQGTHLAKEFRLRGGLIGANGDTP